MDPGMAARDLLEAQGRVVGDSENFHKLLRVKAALHNLTAEFGINAVRWLGPRGADARGASLEIGDLEHLMKLARIGQAR
jgi:hypothetical protein